jgi:hypothetical protein
VPIPLFGLKPTASDISDRLLNRGQCPGDQ